MTPAAAGQAAVGDGDADRARSEGVSNEAVPVAEMFRRLR
jgi:hypothetical protein